MSGALLQLASLSSQDIFLTSNPEITLFKKQYNRYTNFSQETVQVSFDAGSVQFGQETTATLERTGDLISKIVLVIQLNEKTTISQWGYVDRIGHAIIDEIKIRVGQSDVDIQQSDWIDIYQRITKDKSQEENYNKMIGNIPSMKKITTSHDKYRLYIPLEFWTGRNTSSTFPICSLINQQFQISVKLKNAIDIINYYGSIPPTNEDLPIISTGYFLVDYIYLEKEELDLFMNTALDYAIDIVQDMTDTIHSANSKVNLIFDKPTKYLIWHANLDRYHNRNEFMVWAHDNNWEKARNDFAKLVWLITRQGLNASDANNPVILFNDTFVNIGQVPPIITGANTIFEKLASKVDGIILFAQNINGQITANATVDNVVLTRNEITFADMSTTNTEFKEDPNSTSEQINFINIHTFSIIDIFNYGNYINRTDNPIISSSFQINGKNRFQERDGFFYNYMQSYNYLKNSPPDGVNFYTFALHPTNTQPSGTLNLGYVNSKDLVIQLGQNNNPNDTYFNTLFKSGQIRVLALCYNIIKIKNGTASLTY